jgi:hypothetical protein
MHRSEAVIHDHQVLRTSIPESKPAPYREFNSSKKEHHMAELAEPSFRRADGCNTAQQTVRKRNGSGLSRLLAGVLFAAMVTGCTQGNTSDNPADKDGKLPEISIDEFSGTHAKLNPETGTVSLPLDEYTVNDDYGFQITLSHAKAVAANACMVKKGYENPYAKIDWDSVVLPENRVYGPWDVATAQTYGFQLDPTRGTPRLDTLALGVEGNKVFEACYEEVMPQFEEAATFYETPTISDTIRANAYGLALESEKGQAAIQSRSKCLEDQGIILTDDGGPSEDYSGQSKETQIRVATINAKCGVDTNAVQTLFDVHAQYEAAFIKRYEAQLNEIKSKKQELAAELRKAIQG